MAVRLLDNTLKDIRFACRAMLRAPLPALTIVLTVGLGLGSVAVVFTVLNSFVFRMDEVRNPEELFAIARKPSANADSSTFTRPQYETLLRETAVFSGAFAMSSNVNAWAEGRRLEGPFVTGNFFRVLGVNAALGRSLTLSDDEPGGPPVVVLSHRTWSQWFSSDPTVLDRPLLLNGLRVAVVGVMPESFRGLEIAAPDFWAPLSLLTKFRRGQPGRDDARARAAKRDGAHQCRHHCGVHAALLRVRPRADDRLRKRRQPAAGPRCRPPARDRRAAGNRRLPAPGRLAAAH